MPTVRIIRSSEYANRLRKINIFLDGKKIGEISNGESKDFEVTEGSHTLQAKIDWCTSNPYTFTISDTTSKSFTLTSFAKNNSLGIFATIYYITFGYKKFLNLVEEKERTVL